MNVRIRELSEQAKPLDENGQKVRGLNSEYHDLWMENFAVLIIAECAGIARNADLEDVEGGDSAVLRAAGDQIKEHFGVEE